MQISRLHSTLYSSNLLFEFRPVLRHLHVCFGFKRFKMLLAAEDFQVLVPSVFEGIKTALCFKDEIQLFLAVSGQIDPPIGVIGSNGGAILNRSGILKKSFTSGSLSREIAKGRSMVPLSYTA